METLTSPPPRIAAAKINSDALKVRFADGRILSVPLHFFPTLENATPTQRKSFRLETPWTLRWPRLDYDIGAEGLLAGAHERVDRSPIVRSARRRRVQKQPVSAS